MGKIIKNIIGIWGLVIITITAANAALISRLDGQAYYDDVLDITWLTNANLAGTNSFGVDGVNGGLMKWQSSQARFHLSTIKSWTLQPH